MPARERRGLRFRHHFRPDAQREDRDGLDSTSLPNVSQPMPGAPGCASASAVPAEQRVIEFQCGCPSQFLGRVTGGADPRKIWPGVAFAGACREMQSVGTEMCAGGGIIVDQHDRAAREGRASTCGRRPRGYRPARDLSRIWMQRSPVASAAFEALQFEGDAVFLGIGQRAGGGQRQAFEDGAVRGRIGATVGAAPAFGARQWRRAPAGESRPRP